MLRDATVLLSSNLQVSPTCKIYPLWICDMCEAKSVPIHVIAVKVFQLRQPHGGAKGKSPPLLSAKD